MADMHVLTGSKNRWNVIMHFPIPNSNNPVSVNYRTALVNSGLGGFTQLVEGTGPGQITTAEKVQVESGELYEHSVEVFADGTGQSTGGRQALLREVYTVTKDAVIADLQDKLKFFGHTESEV